MRAARGGTRRHAGGYRVVCWRGVARGAVGQGQLSHANETGQLLPLLLQWAEPAAAGAKTSRQTLSSASLDSKGVMTVDSSRDARRTLDGRAGATEMRAARDEKWRGLARSFSCGPRVSPPGLAAPSPLRLLGHVMPPAPPNFPPSSRARKPPGSADRSRLGEIRSPSRSSHAGELPSSSAELGAASAAHLAQTRVRAASLQLKQFCSAVAEKSPARPRIDLLF